jgi:hypothetical protein
VTCILFFYVKLTFISFLFIWVRVTLPRFRYDKLMYLVWRIFLPLSLNYLLFFVDIKCFIFSLLYCINLGIMNLIEDLNFFHKVFKTLGFFCGF